MVKKQGLLLFFIFYLLLLLILLFPYQPSFSQSSTDRIPKEVPKEVAKIPLPKLLDFGAGKFRPWKAMAPILQELTEEYQGRVVIKVIEIYQEPQLTQANRVRLIPMQIFFDANDREIYRQEGFMDKERIKKVFSMMGIK